MEFNMRKAEADDAAAIAKVQVDSWRTTYRGIIDEGYLENLKYEDREKVWTRAIEENPIFLLEDGSGEVVGFAIGGPERSGEYVGYDGELYAIYIHESAQQSGGGRQLVGAVAADLLERGFEKMVISVLEDNPARGFYERLGGHKIGKEETAIGNSVHVELVYGFDDLKVLS